MPDTNIGFACALFSVAIDVDGAEGWLDPRVSFKGGAISYSVGGWVGTVVWEMEVYNSFTKKWYTGVHFYWNCWYTVTILVESDNKSRYTKKVQI